MLSRLPTVARVVCLSLLAFCSAGAAGADVTPFELDGRLYVPIAENLVPTYTIRLFLAPPEGQERQTGFSVLFEADREGNGYRLEADGAEWSLSSVSEGKKEVLARGDQEVLPASEPVEVRIKRHLWLLSVALNGRVVGEVQDYSHGPGLVAVDARSSSPAMPPVVQPLERLSFAENFMRQEGELDLGNSKVWRLERGEWKIHSVRENVETVDVERLPEKRRPQKEQSPNPFSASAFSPDWGFLWAGHWFWDDYRASVSVRNRGAKAVGLAFNVADSEDFFLLRWENAAPVLEATPVELLRIKGGQRTLLRKAWVNGQVDQWFNIGVRTCGARIQAILDGAVIMDLSSDESVGGGVGLYVEGGDEEHQAYFDDVLVRTINRIDYTNETWIGKHSVPARGSWGLKRVEEPGWPPMFAPVLRSRTGSLLLGSASWPAPCLRAQVPVPRKKEKIGFLAGLDGPGGRHWRVTLGRAGDGLSLEILEQGEAGVRQLAACEDVPLPEGEMVELCADFTREGEINVSVDGKLQLRAARTASAVGAPAVFGSRAKGAEFRRLAVCFEREEDEERLPAEEVFRENPYMKHWSSAQGAWWPVEGREDAFWHVGDFYGRSDIEIPLRENILFIHAARAISDEGGYALQQKTAAGEEGQQHCRLVLLRLGQEVASVNVDPATVPDGKVVLHRDGPYIWVTAGGEELLSFRDPQPLRETRAAVSGVSAADLPELKVHRCQVQDYYFERAPADWYGVGRWDVTTRFTCDPRWSHMAAVTSSAGILFNKFRYEGDVTLEAFMGMKQSPEGYPRIGDFNLALFGEPYDLSSGYSFVLAGWDPYWSERATYLLKQGEQVAYCGERLLPSVRRPGESGRVIPVPWIKGGREIHGAWYYVKARKRGHTLSFYVDNHKAYEYHDPEPIETFSPAVWTYDAWIVVARVKVSYERKRVPGRLVAAPPERRQVLAGPAPPVFSPTHPGLREDFEGGVGGWERFDERHGGEPTVVERGRAGGHCLRVTNAGAGGTFAVAAPVGEMGLDALRMPVIRFDYRIPPEAKINLYVDVAGKRYFVWLTGPEGSDAILRRLGEVEVQADGAWHSAEFALGAAYRTLHPGSTKGHALIERIVFGNLHPGLLAAGIGGNPTGASYWLDNFEVCSAGVESFPAEIKAVNGEVAETLVTVDRSPDTIPGQPAPLTKQDLASGLWYCHVRARLKDGRLTGTAHLPFRVAPRRMEFTAVSPPDGKRWGYWPIRLEFQQDAALHLDVPQLKLRVNGKDVDPYPGLFMVDWHGGALLIDLARAGLDIGDGETCLVELSYGNLDGTHGAFRAHYVSSLKDDVTAPGKVEVLGVPAPNDFEETVGSWESSKALVLRDDTTAASGRWSLMLQNPRRGGAFRVKAIGGAFSAGRVPIVDFDYKIHDAVRVDFAVANPHGECTVKFTERSGHGRCLGALEGIQADNEWHHTEINLLKLLRGLPYAPRVFEQQWLGLANYEHRACAPGASYHVDNFRRVPLLSPAVQKSLTLRAYDAGGIRGYSYLWSGEPEGEPDDRVDTTESGAPLEDLPAPDAYLHVKACDRAGNWGPTAHYRFLVDSAGPQVAEPGPSAGARSASSEISFVAREDVSAVDPKSLKMEVGGRSYGPGDPGTTYDLSSGRFTWDWVEGAPADETSVPDGKTIEVKVQASDFAGNPAEPLAWQWVMDYSKDHAPPTVPVVQCETQPVLRWDDFEDEKLPWRNFRNDHWGARVQRIARGRPTDGLQRIARGGPTDGHCLKLSARRSRSHLSALAFEGSYDLRKYPLLSFEYLIPAETRINLQLRVKGTWYELQMTSRKTRHKVLGKLEGLQADGEWHRCSVDLLELIENALSDAGALEVSQIVFADPSRHSKAAAYWIVDRFMISGYGQPQARFTWPSRDITGITGYGVLFGRDPTAEPDARVNVKEAAGSFAVEEPGMHFLGVRACDSVGNWSPTVRFPYFVKLATEPEPQAEAVGGQ